MLGRPEKATGREAMGQWGHSHQVVVIQQGPVRAGVCGLGRAPGPVGSQLPYGKPSMAPLPQTQALLCFPKALPALPPHALPPAPSSLSRSSKSQITKAIFTLLSRSLVSWHHLAHTLSRLLSSPHRNTHSGCLIFFTTTAEAPL